MSALADTLAGGQGPAAAQEETQAIMNEEEILDQFLNYLFTIFSQSSSGAETE